MYLHNIQYWSHFVGKYMKYVLKSVIIKLILMDLNM